MSSSLHHLFHPDNADDYRAAIDDSADRLVRPPHRHRRPPQPRHLPPRGRRAGSPPTTSTRPLGDTGAVLDELSRLWLDDTIWFHEPTYAAHLNCPVVIPALMAEVLISGVNASLDTFDQSVGGTFIERHLVDWTAERIGYDDSADGIFTTGGTQSNLQALLLARGQRRRPAREAADLRQRRRPLLGPEGRPPARPRRRRGHRRSPPTTGAGWTRRRSSRALADSAPRARSRWPSSPPPAPPTSAPSTRCPRSPALARAHGAWFHVDAAYGGGLLVSPRHRDWLAGIELADSVTIDYHKTWFQPVSCSALLVRDGATLGHVTWHADYLNPKDSAHPNQVDKSLQTTRRFEALKLWVTLRVMGADALGELSRRRHRPDARRRRRACAAMRRHRARGRPAAEHRRLPLPARRRARRTRSTGSTPASAPSSSTAAARSSPPPRSTGAASSSSRCSTRRRRADDILGVVELVREAGVATGSPADRRLPRPRPPTSAGGAR